MKPLAVDTHDFPTIRRAGKIYVDKTMYIHRLVTDSNASLFFMSRPRRFGKSLTVSALKSLFSGRVHCHVGDDGASVDADELPEARGTARHRLRVHGGCR